MQIAPDDDIYRVSAVWLGPPKATFPWHVRYVAWAIGIVLFFVVLTAERALGIGMGFFSTAWALVITVALTRWLTKLISYERPFGAVLALVLAELRTPRELLARVGGDPTPRRRPVTVRPHFPHTGSTEKGSRT